MRHDSHAKAAKFAKFGRASGFKRGGAKSAESATRVNTEADFGERPSSTVAARSQRHDREQVPAMSRSRAAHFVPFALPDTEWATGPTRKRASPFTERCPALPCRRTAPDFVSLRGGASVSFGSGGDACIAGHGMSHAVLAWRCDSPSPMSATAAGRDKGFRVSRGVPTFALLAATHYLKPL